MGGDDRDILLAAHERAMTVLSTSKAKAQRMENGAMTEAVELLLEQQRKAEMLLGEQRDALAKGTQSDEESRALLESYRAAAEVLAGTERDEAAELSKAMTDDAVCVLMAGHREASAILLEAWMKVTEGRPSARD